MDRKLFYKLAAIFGVTLILMAALSIIEAQIRQRSWRQTEVQHNIAESSAGSQTLVGPVLVLRWKEALEPEVRKEPDGQVIRVPRSTERQQVIPAEKLKITGTAAVETRHRGIYQAQLYHLDLDLAGHFLVPPNLAGGKALGDVRATLVMGIADLRGVDGDPVITIDGTSRRFVTPGAQTTSIQAEIPGNQMHVDLGTLAPHQPAKLDFTLPLHLSGTERLAIAPTAESNHIRMTSDWRHPSFQGRYLPRHREVGKEGFKAEWEISHLARNLGNTLKANGNNNGQARETLEIGFIEPVNIYLQAERAVKYGSLFILLTFAAFFLREVVRRSPFHPMQYLLVGLALAIFFLLLIALSEHIAFATAYGASALACIGLITVYLAGALGGRLAALGFGGGLTGLYGVLYGVLLSEDNALLMGSVLLFLALGAVMLATRKVDWYALNGRPAETQA